MSTVSIFLRSVETIELSNTSLFSLYFKQRVIQLAVVHFFGIVYLIIFLASFHPALAQTPSLIVVSSSPTLTSQDMRNISNNLCGQGEEENSPKIDPTPGFPPFDNVDDPHPPDYPCDPKSGKRDPFHGDIEANYVAQGERTPNGPYWFQVPYIDLNYGTGFWIFKHLQFKVEGGYSWRNDGGNSDYRSGPGNILFGTKWMFYDGGESKSGIRKDLALGIYPQIQISPFSRSVKNGLADPGKLYIYPFLVTKKFRLWERPVGFTFNTGYKHGTGGLPNSFYWSAATGIAMAAHLAPMASYSQQFNSNFAPSEIRKYELGMVYERQNGSKVFAMAGLEKDGQRHFIWNVGIQKVFHLKRQE